MKCRKPSNVGQVGFIRIIEPAKANGAAIKLHPRIINPVPFVQIDPFVSSGVIFLLARIGHVLRRARLAQIVPFVVFAIAVDMINLSLRPLTRHPQPYKAMSQVKAPLYPYSPIAIRIFRSSKFTRTASALSYEPIKISTLWIVVKQFAKVVSRDIPTGAHEIGRLSDRARLAIESLLSVCAFSGLAIRTPMLVPRQG